MTNPNARKGYAFERLVRSFLAEVFGTWRVRRPHQEGYRDVGDLHVEPSLVLQCKDVARLNVTGWLDDVEVQRQNAGARFGAVVWKRRQKPASAAVVLMDLATLRGLLELVQPSSSTPPADVAPPTWLEN